MNTDKKPETDYSYSDDEVEKVKKICNYNDYCCEENTCNSLHHPLNIHFQE